jgi:hypothetical protein
MAPACRHTRSPGRISDTHQAAFEPRGPSPQQAPEGFKVSSIVIKTVS